MKNWIKLVVITLLLAAVIHVATVAVLPYGITLHTLAGMKQKTPDGQMNMIYQAPPITADSRDVVRPSPDLLYSICVYEVSDKPLHIVAPIPDDTYWSMSFYAINTDNFFVVNDRTAKSNPADILLVGENMPYHDAGDSEVVIAPSNMGVILFRILITDKSELNDLMQVQEQAYCSLVD